MKVSTETVATREVVLTIEPDPDVVQQAMRRAAREISRWRPVPGFRPGRAPYTLVERMFGRELILAQALEEVGSDLFQEALKEADLKAYDQGQMEIESQDPLVLKVNVSLVPQVELGDYSQLRIEPEPEVAITEEQIDAELEAVRRRYAQYNPVERPLQMGDQVTVDIKGVSGEEEIVNDERVTLEVTDTLMPPGFAEALVGMSAGETREFTLTYPEDYEEADLAGREVDYTVTVHTVREIELPEVDDELAKMVGDYETVAELREALADRLKRRLEAERNQKEIEAATEALVGISKVEYPQAALERELDRQVEMQAARVRRLGIPFENYLNLLGQPFDQFRENLRPVAEQALVQRLVLAEYARAEGLGVGDSEMQQELNSFALSMAASYGERAPGMIDEMANSGLIDIIYRDTLLRKAAAHLVARLTGREESGEAEAVAEGGEPEAGEAKTDSSAELPADSAEEGETSSPVS
ncbi:MAG: trigger factor [Chloroflexi bacterium]|nr:trigger factor [Chloroflexota bacterium]